jgi:hypothetical protein
MFEVKKLIYFTLIITNFMFGYFIPQVNDNHKLSVYYLEVKNY